MTFQQVAVALKDYGLPLVMLLLLGMTGARGMWVFGREHKERMAEKDGEISRERARADWWQQRALDQSSMLDRSIELAMRGVQQERKRGG